MDVEARNQYLRELREGYSLARKAAKSRLLDEAVQRTGLPHKVMLRKLGHPVTLVRGPRARRRRTYDAAVAAAWIELWKLLDCPCGRRLPPERRRLRLDHGRGRSLRRPAAGAYPAAGGRGMGPPPGRQPASGLGGPPWPVDRGPFPGDAVHGGHRHPLVGGRAGDGSQRSAVEGRGRRTIGAGSSRRTGPACAIWWATTG